MIRFSHSANSWQLAKDSNGWENISVDEARKAYDEFAYMWYDNRLTFDLVKPL